MLKVVLSSIWYPVSISRYFETALRSRKDIELITVGPYTGTWIPWSGGIHLPEKYAIPPDIPLEKSVRSSSARFLYSHDRLQDVDVWIQCDAGFYFTDRPPCDVLVHIATDPHVLDYEKQRFLADYFFNMQDSYARSGDHVFPYAASFLHHFPEDLDRKYDVCLVGLQYPNRTHLVNKLKSMGLSVYYGLGLGPDEYRQVYNQSRIAISWSSLDDLIARVFEAGAMNIPLVCNRTSYLHRYFGDYEHLRSFTDAENAARQVMDLFKNYDEALKMSQRFHDLVMKKHLYDHRIQTILDEIGA